jgi:hypothetical protein
MICGALFGKLACKIIVSIELAGYGPKTHPSEVTYALSPRWGLMRLLYIYFGALIAPIGAAGLHQEGCSLAAWFAAVLGGFFLPGLFLIAAYVIGVFYWLPEISAWLGRVYDNALKRI